MVIPRIIGKLTAEVVEAKVHLVGTNGDPKAASSPLTDINGGILVIEGQLRQEGDLENLYLKLSNVDSALQTSLRNRSEKPPDIHVRKKWKQFLDVEKEMHAFPDQNFIILHLGIWEWPCDDQPHDQLSDVTRLFAGLLLCAKDEMQTVFQRIGIVQLKALYSDVYPDVLIPLDESFLQEGWSRKRVMIV